MIEETKETSQSDYTDMERFFERLITEELIDDIKGVCRYKINVSLAELELYKEYLARKLPVIVVKDSRESSNVMKSLTGDLLVKRLD